MRRALLLWLVALGCESKPSDANVDAAVPMGDGAFLTCATETRAVPYTAGMQVMSSAGTNDERSDEDLGGRSATVAPVYEVTDDEGHAEEVDTRDLKPLP